DLPANNTYVNNHVAAGQLDMGIDNGNLGWGSYHFCLTRASNDTIFGCVNTTEVSSPAANAYAIFFEDVPSGNYYFTVYATSETPPENDRPVGTNYGAF